MTFTNVPQPHILIIQINQIVDNLATESDEIEFKDYGGNIYKFAGGPSGYHYYQGVFANGQVTDLYTYRKAPDESKGYPFIIREDISLVWTDRLYIHVEHTPTEIESIPVDEKFPIDEQSRFYRFAEYDLDDSLAFLVINQNGPQTYVTFRLNLESLTLEKHSEAYRRANGEIKSRKCSEGLEVFYGGYEVVCRKGTVIEPYVLPVPGILFGE